MQLKVIWQQIVTNNMERLEYSQSYTQYKPIHLHFYEFCPVCSYGHRLYVSNTSHGMVMISRFHSKLIVINCRYMRSKCICNSTLILMGTVYVYEYNTYSHKINVIHMYMHKLCTGPSPPRDLTITRVFQHGIELNWIPPRQTNGDIQHYIIKYTTQNGTEQEIPTTDNASYYNLTGLERGQTYNITVIAVNLAETDGESGAITSYIHNPSKNIGKYVCILHKLKQSAR